VPAKTQLAIALRSSLQVDAPSVGGVENTINFRFALSMLEGTTQDKVDLAYAKRRTLASATGEDLDLAGALVLIQAVDTNTTTLTVSRPAANGAPLFAAVSDALAALGRKGVFLWADPDDGIAITAGSADLVTVTNSAGAIAKYDVILLGTSA
jgi:hypothetical protein